ncbi:MAG: beta-propeller domain-containing protein [Candidatus Aenigmarchaeota archaeon]|nr:beta-propeller domain-containing protein [Candidatus Aenigmarchaeota archaeon]
MQLLFRRIILNALNSKRTGAIPPIIGILLFFALIAGFLTYFLNNGSSSSPAPHEPENGLNTFVSYDEFEAYLRDYSGDYGYYGGVMAESVVKTTMDAAQAVGAPRDAGASHDYSGTNIQVDGVDEADIVKSDGKYIYAVSGSKISIIDACRMM